MGLTQKIWLLITAPFVLAIVAYIAATRPLRRELLLTEASREIREDVSVLESALSHGVVDPDNADLVALTNSVANPERCLGVALFAADGKLLAASDGFPKDLPSESLAQKALASGSVSDVTERDGKTILQHAFRFGAAGPATGGAVVVVRDIDYVQDLLWVWNLKLALVGALGGLVVLALSRPLVERVVGRPLAEVVGGVESVTAGDLEAKVPDAQRDELGRLARAFNKMTSSLRESRKRVEDEQEQRSALESRMRQMQTLAAAGEVAASMAHEIGSPLNVILGRTRMVRMREGVPPELAHELDTIVAQTERITRIVERFLRVSRPIGAMHIESIDLADVAADALALLTPECRKRGIRTELSVDKGFRPRVKADRDQLMQILFNLVHNSVQAQPKGGRIDVLLSASTIEGRNTVDIEVTDAGPGIAPEVRGKIFDRFVTTRKVEGGSGLGLAIVDGMVRELGGWVEADDAKGGGACFRVHVPLDAEVAA
jgi:signal transduction histidine kinase